MLNGLILVDKEIGMSSTDVDRRLKKILNEKKIGHLGTLDPFASGLLICLIGSGTKVATFMEDSIKTYVATIKLGEKTDTLDLTGKVIETKPVKDLNEELIKKTLASFLGKSKQIPPIYSALKRNGVPLYKLARKGIEVEVKEREIDIKDIEFIDYRDHLLTFKATVSSGTYIRTLGSDIAEKLDTCGHLVLLRRSEVSNYNVKDAKKLDDISERDLISIEDALSFLPSYKVKDHERLKALNGVPLDLKFEMPLIVLKDNEGVIAVYRRDKNCYVSQRGFR